MKTEPEKLRAVRCGLSVGPSVREDNRWALSHCGIPRELVNILSNMTSYIKLRSSYDMIRTVEPKKYCWAFVFLLHAGLTSSGF